MRLSENEGPTIVSFGHIDIDSTRFTAEPDLDCLPILATQNLVLFPGVTTPVSLVRESSVSLAQEAVDKAVPVGIVCQLNPDDEDPDVEGLHRHGVVADVLRVFDFPNGMRTAIVRARGRFTVEGKAHKRRAKGHLYAKVGLVSDIIPDEDDADFKSVVDAVRDVTLRMLDDNEVLRDFAENLRERMAPVDIVNTVATQAPLPTTDKTDMLAQDNVKLRAEMLLGAMTRQEQMLKVAQNIQQQARQSFDQQQREAFLQRQLETIRQELYGDQDDDQAQLRKRADATAFPANVKKIFDKELNKLARFNPQSPDYSTQYSYLEALLDLPWNKYSTLNTDITLAAGILDRDHYGLRKVKERVLEQIAVLLNNPDGKSPILCLVGPPGVGKTSLGQSIAEALGRKYQRVSLGGLHDEAEIRGHRRTYIGAMPGRIIDAMKRAGTSNPVLLLDEVDKLGRDFKGDPSAALLEVLDPEQNCKFHDNYVDVDYDLSKVLFIATANTLSTLSQPLLDRMEIINLSGYILEEKVEIAQRHILPRLLKEHRLKRSDLTLRKDALAMVIEKYTSESGVRQLEKAIAQIVRKAVYRRMTKERCPKTVTASHVADFLGVPRFTKDRYEGNEFAGVVTGLAWTAVGGEILYIESSLSRAKGEKLTLTGNLGDVMKESAMLALQYVKSHASELGIDDALFEKYQLHVHVPEGAIPKDGPSAGITMAASIVSAFTQRKVRPRLAMTGEITLRGKVLPVGGIKEKILAAKRAGITDIILSTDNRKDVEDIDSQYIDGLAFHYVNTVMEVVDIAILPEKVADARQL